MNDSKLVEFAAKYGAVRASDLVNGAEEPIITFSTSVEGLESSGKTHIPVMTFPTPLVHVNFRDRDATIFAYDMSPERRERVFFHSLHPSTEQGWTREEGRQSLAFLSTIAKDYLSEGRMAGGTFVLDSGSSWWQALQEVYVAPEEEKAMALAQARGKDYKKAGGLIYGPANLIVQGVLNWIKNQGVFLVITHQMFPEWDKDGPIPGKYKPRMNTQVPYVVEIRLRLKKLCVVCAGQECMNAQHVDAQGRRRRFIGQIVKFGNKTALFEGMELEDPTFSTLYALYVGRPFPTEEALR